MGKIVSSADARKEQADFRDRSSEREREGEIVSLLLIEDADTLHTNT